MKKILVICFSNLSKDPRVYRHVKFLKEKYEISTIGFEKTGIENGTFYRVVIKRNFLFAAIRRFMLIFKMFEKAYWCQFKKNKCDDLLKLLLDKKFDLIIANDINTLPLALKISNGAKILFDAHEYYPHQFKTMVFKNHNCYNKYLCGMYFKKSNKVITVSDGIASEYHKNFGIMPIVIKNTADYINLKPTEVNEKHINLIHHGGAMPDREIEVMIKMMDYLDKRFYLNLILVAQNKKMKKYLKKLKFLAKGKNVKFLDPFPMQEIVKSINKYDIGVYILRPTSLNKKFALPNKFFEFIQARLAIAIGPSLKMKELVEKYNLGIVSKDFDPKSMAKSLNFLTTEKIMYYKNQSSKIAYEMSSIKEMKKLDNIIAELLL
jgi:hypothetical protein